MRKFYNGKIPAETTNDAEQLKITLSKCKKTLEQEVGEVAVYGIRDYEQSKEINAINFNVNMNVSPENKTTNSITNTSNSINASSACGSETIVSNSASADVCNHPCDESQDMKRPQYKSGRARKLAFKRKRKHKYRKKHNVKYYSSSSSDSQSESSSSCSSEDSESGKFYVSRRKHKKLRSKQRRNRIDVRSSANNSTTTGPSLANVERQRENLFFAPTPYFHNNGP